MDKMEYKGFANRIKILYLYKILLEQTDANHGLTMPEIIDKLEEYGINAQRKALYQDILALEKFGVDVQEAGRGRSSTYKIVGRDFDFEELKLLIDAVLSSRLLTQKKSEELVKKLKLQCSVAEAESITRRSMYVTGRTNNDNKNLFINLDKIDTALMTGKKISFNYYDYNIRAKKVLRGSRRECSPVASVFDNDKYYMLAVGGEHEKVKIYRVDRMNEVEISGNDSTFNKKDFNVKKFLSESFQMYGTDPQKVKMRFHKSCANIVIDQFGKIPMKEDDENDDYFIVEKSVCPAPTFFSWIFMMKDNAEILAPQEVRGQYLAMLSSAQKNFFSAGDGKITLSFLDTRISDITEMFSAQINDKISPVKIASDPDREGGSLITVRAEVTKSLAAWLMMCCGEVTLVSPPSAKKLLLEIYEDAGKIYDKNT